MSDNKKKEEEKKEEDKKDDRMMVVHGQILKKNPKASYLYALSDMVLEYGKNIDIDDIATYAVDIGGMATCGVVDGTSWFAGWSVSALYYLSRRFNENYQKGSIEAQRMFDPSAKS